MPPLLGSEEAGLGSVLTAAGGTAGGPGPSTGDPLVIGKFTGMIVGGEGTITAYLADPGQQQALAEGVLETTPQLYPTGARTFKKLWVTATNGNGGTAYTVTLMKNGVATTQQVTISAAATAGEVFSDTTHPIAFSDSDKYDVRVQKAGSADDAALMSVTLEGGAGGGGGGGGGGSVESVTSDDGSITVVDPTGPTVDLSVPLATPAAAGRMTATQWQQLGLDWWSQRMQHAIGVLNSGGTIQVDEPKRYDFSLVPPIVSGVAPPTIDTTRSGGIYQFGGANTGQLIYSPLAGSNLVANPTSEPFYVSAKVRYNGATITGPQATALLLLAAGSTVAPYGNNYLEITLIAGSSATHHFIAFDNGSGSPAVIDLGASCALAGPLCPVLTWIAIAIKFDPLLGQLVVYFQDVPVVTLNSGAGAWVKMPIVPLTLGAFANNASALNMEIGGGFGMIKGPMS